MNNAQIEYLNRYSGRHSTENIYREVIEMISSIAKVKSDFMGNTDKVKWIRAICAWFEGYEDGRAIVKGGYRQ